MKNKNNILKSAQEIFNASEEKLKEWESYGEGIQADKALREVLEEQALEALKNEPVMKISLLYSGSPMALCAKRAASSTQQCTYEDSTHYQYVQDEKVKIQIPLEELISVSHTQICFTDKEGKEERLEVEEMIQDQEEIFVDCGSIDNLKQKIIAIQKKLNITVDDDVTITLEIYRKE